MNFLLFILTIVASYFIFKSLVGSMSPTRLNMISVIYYYYIIALTLIGSYAIVEGFGDNPAIEFVSDDTRLFGYYIIIYSIFAFCAGGLVAKKILIGAKSADLMHEKYFFKKIVRPKGIGDSFIKIWLILLTILSLFSALYVTFIKGSVPQLSFFTLNDQIGNLLSRVSFERDFSGFIYIKTVLFEQVAVLLSLVLYCYYLMNKSTVHFLWFLLAFIVAVYSVTFSLSKSQLIVYFSYFVFIRIYSQGEISKKFIFLLLIFMFSVLALLFYLVTKMDLEGIAVYMLNRIFLDQISGTFLMFEIFPDEYNYIGFCSLSNLIPKSLCTQTEPATRLAMEHAFPYGSLEGVMNLLSTYYLGEAWANFGYIGLIMAPLYMGFLISFFYFTVLKIEKNPFTLALLAFVSFGTNFASQFNGYIYNMLFIVTVFIVFFPLLTVWLVRPKFKLRNAIDIQRVVSR